MLEEITIETVATVNQGEAGEEGRQSSQILGEHGQTAAGRRQKFR